MRKSNEELAASKFKYACGLARKEMQFVIRQWRNNRGGAIFEHLGAADSDAIRPLLIKAMDKLGYTYTISPPEANLLYIEFK
ncbi:hypothetical protein VOWphi5012_060 [Vibrio phage phi50-12]|uniref:Uncharacterized protein n=1 Tax=Vibrio phage phi50-12 TaxID=2654972 RepID=A0A5P8PRB3_9CAUD|nr:hypothetical protein KNU82_gp060 [Vibrio phage phi50-12]QFR59844.1 hypothetical protein VOWphi5012_060 [Vibrio phage phi50-12]